MNSKFGVCWHVGMVGVEYHFSFTVSGAYAPIFFEVRISYWGYGCILGWGSLPTIFGSL